MERFPDQFVDFDYRMFKFFFERERFTVLVELSKVFVRFNAKANFSYFRLSPLIDKFSMRQKASQVLHENFMRQVMVNGITLEGDSIIKLNASLDYTMMQLDSGAKFQVVQYRKGEFTNRLMYRGIDVLKYYPYPINPSIDGHLAMYLISEFEK